MPSTVKADIVEEALRTLEKRIARARTSEAALELGAYYGLFAAANYSPTYDGGHVEDAFVAGFGADFARAVPPAAPLKDVVHLISTSYKTGGHTRLMERLASMHDVPPDLVITEQSNVDYVNAESTPFSQVHDVSARPLNDRLRQLVALLSGYKKIILHIHPHDFVAAVAVKLVRARTGCRVCFVNHADHVFSFGRASADVVLQVSAFGELLGRARSPALRTSFLGIPLQADWAAIEFSAHDDQSILTAGAQWKYRPRAGLSLPTLLNGLLRVAPHAKIRALGIKPWRDWWWWTLKIRHPRRVTLSGTLPFKEYIQHLNSYSFVLDSFPITGGTAFPEAILQGRIAMGIRGPVTGYTPADELRAVDIHELGVILQNPADYVARLMLLLPQLKEVHGYNEVQARYLGALAGKCSENPLVAGFQGDPFFFEKKYLRKLDFPAIGSGRSAVGFEAETFIFMKFFKYLSLKSIVKYGLGAARLARKERRRRLSRSTGDFPNGPPARR